MVDRGDTLARFSTCAIELERNRRYHRPLGIVNATIRGWQAIVYSIVSHYGNEIVTVDATVAWISRPLESSSSTPSLGTNPT